MKTIFAAFFYQATPRPCSDDDDEGRIESVGWSPAFWENLHRAVCTKVLCSSGLVEITMSDVLCIPVLVNANHNRALLAIEAYYRNCEFISAACYRNRRTGMISLYAWSSD